MPPKCVLVRRVHVVVVAFYNETRLRPAAAGDRFF